MTIVSEACATATPDPRHETATAGFTLVEVLVALILVAVMSSLMVVFIGQAGALVRIDSASEAETEVNAAVRFSKQRSQTRNPCRCCHPIRTRSIIFRALCPRFSSTPSNPSASAPTHCARSPSACENP